MKKLLRGLMYVLPLMLLFSYYPVIRLGGNETMNFELSLTLIWLVVFDVVGVVAMTRWRLWDELLKGRRKWLWVLFPVWCVLSVVWSLNTTRGVLTAGVLGLVYLAVAVMICAVPRAAGGVAEFRGLWLKWFWGASLLACGWCAVQCVLDLAGASHEASLMCAGCGYEMFGFPHPNGWTIEPQFMGNLLLAPVMLSVALIMRGNYNSISRGRGSSRPSLRGSDPLFLGRDLRTPLETLLLITLITLFLTFSRGAIYAMVVGVGFLSALEIVRQRRGAGGRGAAKRVGLVWLTVGVAFLAALNLQGLMAQVSRTDDTYATGVAKVINHLSLGVIKLLLADEVINNDGENINLSENINEAENINGAGNINEAENINGGENINLGGDINEGQNKAVFDGYVAESTDTRVRLSNAAVEIWRKDAATAAFGVGLGGAGQALYDNGLSPAPKEIVQNEYASLLLETGLIGLVLFALTVVLVVRVFIKSPNGGVLLALVVAYGVTLCFFSGLPNALQIYLMPAALYMVLRK